MPRYWVIAPVESTNQEQFDKVWNFDINNGAISIGWHQLGDISRLNREELSQAIASTYPDKPPATRSLYRNMLWAFYHEIVPGDFVIARRGLKTLAGVGRVVQPAVYSPGRNPAIPHPNFLSVEWNDQPRDKTFSTLVFLRQTLAEISESAYRSLLGGSGIPPLELEPSEAVEDAGEFVLEKYLEDFIVSNFDAIFKGALRIYQDAEGEIGQQFQTDEIGRIDILAIDPTSDSFVVIELKKGRPSDQVVGQTLRYMGWVKKNLCKEGQGVRGLVICRDRDPKLSYALEMTPSIDVRYYNVSFKLSEAL